MKLFEADFRYEVRNEPVENLANIFVEELTDRELYELTKKIIAKMDSTYVNQLLEEVGGM